AKMRPKPPSHVAALVALPPRKSRISFGRTGAINPNASMSSITVTKIKTTAALRSFIARSRSPVATGLWPVGSDVAQRRGYNYLPGCQFEHELIDDSALLSFAQNGGTR